MSRNLALLRGINVGGKNLISKDDLRRCFEELGFRDVRTYIQSGNVLFRSDRPSMKELVARIEDGLSRRFSYEARAAVLSYERYRKAISSAPDDWGEDASRRHNALFTLRGVTPKGILAGLSEPKAELESVAVGGGVIFWSASIADFSRTTMAKISKESCYQQLTIRNHNTTRKLLELLDAMGMSTRR